MNIRTTFFSIAALLITLPTSNAFAFRAMNSLAVLGESSLTKISDICKHEEEHEIYYTSASCEALDAAARALGGACDFRITKYPSGNGCNGEGICACVWPSDS